MSPDGQKRPADEIGLTHDGHAAVRLTPAHSKPSQAERAAILEAARASGAAKATPGPCAARSQDFLYDDDGLPA